MALKIIGDLLGDGAVRPARKTAVQIAAVDRRRAAARAKRRVVHEGHDNDAALHILSFERRRELRERDRPLVFVAVIAARQQRGRAVAVANHRDWDHHGAPRGGVMRMRQFQEAVLFAVGMKIHRWLNGRCAHMHYSFTNSLRGVLQKVSTPFSVIRMLSVISRPQSSSHKPGMK